MFAHNPFDGSTRPFTIGLRPLDPDDWIEPDDQFEKQMADKVGLFAERPADVFRALPDTLLAQQEVCDLLLAYLPRRYPSLYGGDEAAICLKQTGRRYSPVDWRERPLALAAHLVQDDLVLMRKSEEGYRLVAGALCFPSSWSLAEKFDRPMMAIHAPVPGFRGQMADRVDRIFDNLKVEKPVWRLNWSIYGDDTLYHPTGGSLPRAVNKHGKLDETTVFIRVERQTLRKLPLTSDILFTIRIYHRSLADLKTVVGYRQILDGLVAQIESLDPDQLAYKDLDRYRRMLVKLMG